MTRSCNGFTVAVHASVQRVQLHRICATTENVMSAASTTRRDVLATSAAAGAFSLIAEQMPQAAEGSIAIRPFHNINVPEMALVDLRRRIAATQWPERETVADQSQGVQLAVIQQLARYWATGYDWRKVVAKMNDLPQLHTDIDG